MRHSAWHTGDKQTGCPSCDVCFSLEPGSGRCWASAGVAPLCKGGWSLGKRDTRERDHFFFCLYCWRLKKKSDWTQSTCVSAGEVGRSTRGTWMQCLLPLGWKVSAANFFVSHPDVGFGCPLNRVHPLIYILFCLLVCCYPNGQSRWLVVSGCKKKPQKNRYLKTWHDGKFYQALPEGISILVSWNQETRTGLKRK